MESRMTAIEVTGTVSEDRRLELDKDLPISGPMRVRVIVLYPIGEEWDEQEWLHAGARNPVFNYLKEPEEDIYSLDDGEPFHSSTTSSDDGDYQFGSQAIGGISSADAGESSSTFEKIVQYRLIEILRASLELPLAPQPRRLPAPRRFPRPTAYQSITLVLRN